LAHREQPAGRTRVVIVGAGFGGIAAARALARAPVDVTIVDRHNYHLFQPLLYQVATAALSPADIAAPIRSVLRGQRNASVMLARVTGIDREKRVVHAGARGIPYDVLVVATGARHAYFGHDEWEAHAQGLKKIDDATYLRRRILLAFELAETQDDPQERRRLLNFVVVGGGPTGVEMAGAIAELARRALSAEFRSIDPRDARVILLEGGPRILAPFEPRLSEAAKRALEELGVEVRLSSVVTACDADGVAIGAERIESRTVIWAAGVRASQAAKWLGAETDGVGRAIVGEDLTLPGHPEIFVIGDTAHVPGPGGRPLPGIAAVAKQQGQHAARSIATQTRSAFRYRDYGTMATIGRKKAVAQIGRLRLSGYPAWLLWSLAHVYFLVGFRNRASVLMSWAWSYLTYERGSRLITGAEPEIDMDAMQGTEAPAPAAAAALRGAA
jgi:NADH dehydrogenase